VLGGWGHTFLHGSGTTHVATEAAAGSGGSIENLVAGGGHLATDLTNFGNLVSPLTKGTDDPSQGSGSQTTPETFGIGALAHLDDSGKPESKDLLPKDPSHSGGS